MGTCEAPSSSSFVYGPKTLLCGAQSKTKQSTAYFARFSKSKTPLIRFVVDLLYNLSTTSPQQIHNKSNKWSLTLTELRKLLFETKNTTTSTYYTIF